MVHNTSQRKEYIKLKMLMNKNVTLGATKLAKAMIKLSLFSFCYADLKCSINGVNLCKFVACFLDVHTDE